MENWGEEEEEFLLEKKKESGGPHPISRSGTKKSDLLCLDVRRYKKARSSPDRKEDLKEKRNYTCKQEGSSGRSFGGGETHKKNRLRAASE